MRSCIGRSFDIPREHGQRTCLHNPDSFPRPVSGGWFLNRASRHRGSPSCGSSGRPRRLWLSPAWPPSSCAGRSCCAWRSRTRSRRPSPWDAVGDHRVVCSRRVGRDLGLATGSSRSPPLLRLVAALWGHSCLPRMLEYVIMIHFSDADWDTPPGTGCVTVAGITIPAILIVIKTLSTPQRGRDDEPQTHPRSGSLTLA